MSWMTRGCARSVTSGSLSLACLTTRASPAPPTARGRLPSQRAQKAPNIAVSLEGTTPPVVVSLDDEALPTGVSLEDTNCCI